MATVKQLLVPAEAVMYATNFPEYRRTSGTNFPVDALFFDATTDEACVFKIKLFNYGSGNITLIIHWYADTATSANVVWEAQLACITPDTDTQDIETKSLATLNYVQDTHLGTTGQRLHKCTLTLSNLDSAAADDEVYIRFARDANGTNATDDMTGDAAVTMVEVQYSDT